MQHSPWEPERAVGLGQVLGVRLHTGFVVRLDRLGEQVLKLSRSEDGWRQSGEELLGDGWDVVDPAAAL